MPEICFCGKEASSLCNGCEKVRYCGQECQLAAWPQHNAICKTSRAFWNKKLDEVCKGLLSENQSIMVKRNTPEDETAPEPPKRQRSFNVNVYWLIADYVKETVLSPILRRLTYLAKGLDVGNVKVHEALWTSFLAAPSPKLAEMLVTDLMSDAESGTVQPYVNQFRSPQNDRYYYRSPDMDLSIMLNFGAKRYTVEFQQSWYASGLRYMWNDWLPAIYYFYLLHTEGKMNSSDAFIFKLLKQWTSWSIRNEEAQWAYEEFGELSFEFKEKTLFPTAQLRTQRRLFAEKKKPAPIWLPGE